MWSLKPPACDDALSTEGAIVGQFAMGKPFVAGHDIVGEHRHRDAALVSHNGCISPGSPVMYRVIVYIIMYLLAGRAMAKASQAR